MKIRSRRLNLVASFIGTVCLRALFLTVRVDHRHIAPEGTPYLSPKGTQRYTFCMWHDHIVLAVFSLKTFNLAGLISQHRDGGYLADSVKIAGIQPVRGSTSRGGMEAVREILSLPDHHLAMTPDGPRGPRHQMKEGIVYISSRSGRPIVPTALVANRFWSVPGGWSDMIIPKPFSKVLLISGTPMVIADNLPREEMTAWAEFLQSEMARLHDIALRMIAGDESASVAIDRTGDATYGPQHACEPTSRAA